MLQNCGRWQQVSDLFSGVENIPLALALTERTSVEQSTYGTVHWRNGPLTERPMDGERVVEFLFWFGRGIFDS